MYRNTRIKVIAGDDSGSASVVVDQAVTQTSDLTQEYPVLSIAPNASEATVLTNVINAYHCVIASTYPVMVRLNGNAATQFTMRSNQTAQQNTGATPLYQCIAVLPFAITQIKLAPISGATQTATVKIFLTGDPAVAYV